MFIIKYNLVYSLNGEKTHGNINYHESDGINSIIALENFLKNLGIIDYTMINPITAVYIDSLTKIEHHFQAIPFSQLC